MENLLKRLGDINYKQKLIQKDIKYEKGDDFHSVSRLNNYTHNWLTLETKKELLIDIISKQ